MPIFEELLSFASKERSRFENYDDNRFGLSLNVIYRYRNFLKIIEERHKSLSLDFIKSSKEIIKSTKKSYNDPMSIGESKAIELNSKINNELQLEIESFYIFAKILLDRITDFIGLYFGKINGISYVSHHTFYKKISLFINNTEAKVSENLIEKAKLLQTEIIDFRDDHIIHKTSPRDLHGIMWQSDGKTQIFKNKIFPKEADKQIISKNIDVLLSEIDQYILQVIMLINNNPDKTKLKLKDEI